MTESRVSGAIQKLPTHIPGFDLIAMGGLSRGRTTLVTGTAGSGKTIFASQFRKSRRRTVENRGLDVLDALFGKEFDALCVRDDQIAASQQQTIAVP